MHRERKAPMLKVHFILILANLFPRVRARLDIGNLNNWILHFIICMSSTYCSPTAYLFKTDFALYQLKIIVFNNFLMI